MGQGYIAIILADKRAPADAEQIRTWVNSHHYDNGYKLMEHSYLRNNYVWAVENLLSPQGQYYKSRIVWAGDYADNEPECTNNLYHQAYSELNEPKISKPESKDMTSHRFIVNHSKGLFVDKTHKFDGFDSIHPLPLLTSEGNGRGGGDYKGTDMELIGTWARDIISVDSSVPQGFKELVCEFTENRF